MNQIVKNRFRIALAVLILSQGQAIAQEALSIDTDSNTYVRTADGPFDDIAFAVEQAIINEGLVIDLTSHVGDMLARTKEDVSGTKDLFTHARIFSFCSAAVSREVMESDPSNIQHCPYTIFVYETVENPNEILVGHRNYPGETMTPVNKMLSRIVDFGVE